MVSMTLGLNKSENIQQKYENDLINRRAYEYLFGRHFECLVSNFKIAPNKIMFKLIV